MSRPVVREYRGWVIRTASSEGSPEFVQLYEPSGRFHCRMCLRRAIRYIDVMEKNMREVFEFKLDS